MERPRSHPRPLNSGVTVSNLQTSAAGAVYLDCMDCYQYMSVSRGGRTLKHRSNRLWLTHLSDRHTEGNVVFRGSHIFRDHLLVADVELPSSQGSDLEGEVPVLVILLATSRFPV